MAFDRVVGTVLLGVGLTLALGGCVIDIADVCLEDDCTQGTAVASASFFRSASVQGLTALELVGGLGAVTVRGEPGLSEILIHAQRRVRADTRREAEASLRTLQILVSTGAGTLRIETRQPDPARGRSYIVDYQIEVPDHLPVAVLNGSGEVEILDLRGDLTVENGNGDIRLQGFRGSSWISLGNGEIQVRGR